MNMSGKNEKAARRALRMYEGVVRDVDKLKCGVETAEKKAERAMEAAGDQTQVLAGACLDMDKTLRRMIRRERKERRKAAAVAGWALALAVVEGLGLAALAAVVLL